MNFDANNRELRVSAIVALAAIGIAGNIAPFILPIIVGSIVDHLGLNVQQASYIAFSDMLGLGLGTLIWAAFITRANWRYSGLVSISILIVANIVSANLHDFGALMFARFFAGLGAGLLLAITNSGLSHAKDPDRVVGIYMMSVLLFATLALFGSPHLVENFGLSALFYTIAGFASFFALGAFLIPEKLGGEQQAKEESLDSASNKVPLKVKISSALGVFCFFFAASLFWVYIERIGRAANFNTSDIATSLSTSQFVGALGAVTAAVVSTRLGSRFIPILTAIILAVGASGILLTDFTVFTYAAAASALIFSWNIIYPYLIGLLKALDPSARLVSISIAMQASGKAFSPALGGLIIVGGVYTPVAWVCIIFFLASFLCFLPGLAISDKKLRVELSSTQTEKEQLAIIE